MASISYVDSNTTNLCIDVVKSHPIIEDEKVMVPWQSSSFLGSDESFVVPLKVDRHADKVVLCKKKDKKKFLVDDDDDEHECTTTTATSNPCNDDSDDARCRYHRLSVGFSDDVSVRIIPRRCDYPEELRRTIFPNRKEISSNAARNMMEFEYEGFDWRNVKEGRVQYK
jgi:hypothetical protein